MSIPWTLIIEIVGEVVQWVFIVFLYDTFSKSMKPNLPPRYSGVVEGCRQSKKRRPDQGPGDV